MKHIIYIIGFLSFWVFYADTCAQGQKIMSIQYSAGLPANGLSKFIPKENFDGFTIESRYFILDNISIGIILGSNDFSKTFPRQIYKNENGSISSVRTRYFQTSPILLTGHYYLAVDKSIFSPYAGLGIGGYINEYAQWDGTFPSGFTKFNFGFKPEAGVLIRVLKTAGFNLKAGYNFNTFKYDMINNMTFFEANAGIYLVVQ